MREIKIKLERVRQLLLEHKLDALLLTKKNNFAWLTGGRDCHIETVGEQGAARLLITQEDQYVVCNNIEAGRLIEEELVGLPFVPLVFPWYEETPLVQEKRFAGMNWGVDANEPGMVNMSLPLARLRAVLTPEEVERYHWLGKRTSVLLEECCREIRQGESEWEIEARLTQALRREGITPYVTLIAADERIFRFRHPIPTGNRVDKYAMVVVCAERYGLIANATRLVHFGPLPAELEHKLTRVLQVEAALIQATRPGMELRAIFAEGVAEYARVGFADQWQQHHQGGPAGYNPRDYVATPRCTERVQAQQAFAWNPSITGVKTEDTILVTATGFEWLTSPGDWPAVQLTYGSQQVKRPAILVK